ncbi:MAG: DNA topoisomerase 3 [Deltaproteobacteria bacterium]|nr:DNA topoisomerase 3 [Deltaproteobacteria bacterium]
MVRVVVAEKPSVARDIAQVLGARSRGDGHLHGSGWVVTWALGHLVTLPQPHQVDRAWKPWRWERLPMLPRHWPLAVLEKTADQFAAVKRLITGQDVEYVVCATDAGREGELIFRFIYDAAGCRAPTRRLWISSLTADAIRRGFAALQPGSARDALAEAARGRAQADWLVGMNLSRAYSLGQQDVFSVGRVQTPTLAMLVERENAIRAFVPADYLEVVANFRAPGGAYTGRWFAPTPEKDPLSARRRLPAEGQRAGDIAARVNAAGRGCVERLDEETRRMPPPQLYDLTELQRHANRLFGFSAEKTLNVAQSLYETHKLLSYPRTDSRHLSADVAATLPAVVAAIAHAYQGDLAPDTGARPLGRRHVDDTEVTDHHAIIPTTVDARALSLTADERKVYDLVCRRLLMAWHPEHIWAVTNVVTRVDTPAGPERFHSHGTAVQQVGFKVLDVQRPGAARRAPGPRDDDDDDAADQDLPGGLQTGLEVGAGGAKVERKQTRPPKRYTDATLLSAMEGAGRIVEDKELSRAMKDRGLGTPATRAAILENLIKRAYVQRDGRALAATDKGIDLIARVHPDVKSPAMTGDWEAQLKAVERGQGTRAEFIQRVETYVTDVVGRVRNDPVTTRPPPPPAATAATRSVSLAQRDMQDLLTRVFGHARFRPHQEEVCRAVASGDNALLVMPTGAGKSLCYQLPGLCRGGTTLVISPLIALMEDQVAKLQSLGLAAERIHSGRDRPASRAACEAYLQGTLDFLFIAPERLAVPGFPELLARRKPALIAVDEAHCISQWGHDFRPDYRMLSQRLPLLLPAPVLALTATATPRVQQDIVEQLGMEAPRRFIHGFRRENLALELVEVPKPARFEAALRALSEPERRPAILYAPSRADAEELASFLSPHFSAAAYHAGMTARARDTTQTAFQAGKLDAVVATIAFGMGIDKADIRTVVHLALPVSVEGYYQEVGRAGRDGKPSRAVLMHSYVDRRMHQFFREKTYPPTTTLAQLLKRVPAHGIPRGELRARARLDEEEFDAALDKLWVHRAVTVDADETVRPTGAHWQQSYEAQVAHRIQQEEAIARFAQAHGCRMLRLVQHFGDTSDPGTPCGMCDACDPGACTSQQFTPPDAAAVAGMRAILGRFPGWGAVSLGALFRDVETAVGDRRAFEILVSALVRAGLVHADEAVFHKVGKDITYQRLALTPDGEAADDAILRAVQLPRGLEPTATRGRRRRTKARTEQPAAPADGALVERLREWRKKEAHKRGVPAFRVMADKVLHELAARRPADEEQLEQVSGVGTAFVKKYGKAVLGLVGRHR